MQPSRPTHPGNPTENDPIPPITEKQLARLWERRAARHRTFHDETGTRVRVLYPGRPGVTAGPDFRNALLLVEGQGLVQGDVEVHLRQRDWRSHGHHQDPNYNGVVLHVALDTDREPSRTNGGGAPPVVNLADLLKQPQPAGGEEDVPTLLWQILAQHGFRRPDQPQQMEALLNRAGDERFLAHGSRFRTLAALQPPEQTLWESICDALGYRHNRHPFLKLATIAPYSLLSAAATRLAPAEREAALGTWLLRLASFEQGYVPPGFGPALDVKEWRLFRVRPPNHPRRRILGAAALIARFCETGMLSALRSAADTGHPKTLTSILTVAAPDDKTAPIGPARARDIAVNVVLPFLHASGTISGDHANAGQMLGLYRRYGPLSDNEITRELAAILQHPSWGRIANNARRQQGLIHLQRLLAGATPNM